MLVKTALTFGRSHMKFRCVLVVFAMWVLFASDSEAQKSVKTFRIGMLVPGSEASSRGYVEGLRQGLVEQGLIEGNNVVLEFKFANGRVDQLPSLAAVLVGSGVDLIFAGSDQAARAAKRASDKIPIVAVTCDALAAEIVTNLRQPGENLTGVTCINADLDGKRVELLKEALSLVPRLGVVLNPNDKRMIAELEEITRAVKGSSTELLTLPVIKPDDIASVFARAGDDGITGAVVVFDAMTFFHRSELADAAVRNHVATIFNFREYVDAGGLISYGPNLRDMFRQSARHIKKIMMGEQAGKIPMEQPVKFELVINLRTAKGLGLALPASLLARAEEVID
jgi:putative ABC transport system substrate-binding protein